MKKSCFVIILVFCCNAYATMAQKAVNDYEEVLLKGYLISWYNANEIANAKKPNPPSMIDYEHYTIFRPINIDISATSFVDSVDFYKGYEVNRRDSTDIHYWVNKFCKQSPKEFNRIKMEPMFDGSFFELNGNKKYLYKIFYIESKAVKVVLDNTSENASLVGAPHNKNYKYVTCYYMFKDIVLQEIKNVKSDNWKRIY